MILGEPSLRPPTPAVLKHPLFWSKEKALTYLQDVSDRVDRETTDSSILASIERNRMEIVKGIVFSMTTLLHILPSLPLCPKRPAP